MRHLTVDVLAPGALIAVEIGVGESLRRALIREGKPVPPAVQIDLLIDTGASRTSVDTSVMRTLGLEPRSATEYTDFSSKGLSKQTDVYVVELVLGGVGTGNTWRHDPLEVLTESFLNLPHQGLLGRDVINRGQLSYNGATRKCTLSYT